MTVVSQSLQLTVDEMFRVLNDTEDLEEKLFKLGEDNVKFVFDVDADADDPLIISINSEKFSLTGESALQAFAFAKISKGLVDIYDLDIIIPMVNWYYENKDGDLKALVKDKKVIAFCRPGTEIYSNTEILKEVLRAVDGFDVTNVFFEKIHHDYRETQYCLVIPQMTKQLSDGSVLRAGIHVQNSVIGLKPLVMSGYTSRDSVGNGQLSDTAFEQWDRKKTKSNTNILEGTDSYDVYTWSFDTTDTLIRCFKKDAELVADLQGINVGDHSGALFNDVFTKFSVPVGLRKLVREEYADQLGQTIFDFWNAITMVAERPELDGSIDKQLKMMAVGGKLASHPNSCESCHRLKDDVV